MSGELPYASPSDFTHHPGEVKNLGHDDEARLAAEWSLETADNEEIAWRIAEHRWRPIRDEGVVLLTPAAPVSKKLVTRRIKERRAVAGVVGDPTRQPRGTALRAARKRAERAWANERQLLKRVVQAGGDPNRDPQVLRATAACSREWAAAAEARGSLTEQVADAIRHAEELEGIARKLDPGRLGVAEVPANRERVEASARAHREARMERRLEIARELHRYRSGQRATLTWALGVPYVYGRRDGRMARVPDVSAKPEELMQFVEWEQLADGRGGDHAR